MNDERVHWLNNLRRLNSNRSQAKGVKLLEVELHRTPGLHK